MSDNWVVQNLVVALGVWNQKLTEIWSLSPLLRRTLKAAIYGT